MEDLNQKEYPFGVMKLYISPSKGVSRRTIQVKLNSDIFDDEFILRIKEDCIIMQRLTMDFTGKTRRFTSTNSGWHQSELSGCIFNSGTYYADEEDSDFDRYVFYINN